MILLLLLFSACFASTIHGQKLHEHMTKEEIELVFKVNHDDVHKLEYDVVPVFHKREEILRSANPKIHLRAFNKNYTLYLEKNEHVLLGTNTPVYIAKASPAKSRRYSDEQKIVYSRIPYPLPENFKLYHDLQNRAAVTLHTDDDEKVHVHGTVGDDIIIRSLPPRVHKEVLNERSSFFNQISNSDLSFIDDDDDFGVGSSSSYQSTHHVILKPSQQGYSPFLNSISDVWDSLTHQFVNPSYKPVNSFQSWGSTFNRPNHKPVSWHPTYIKPINEYPTSTRRPVTAWNPFHYTSATKKPFPWRPVTHEPFTWRPATHEPFTWRPATHEPFTWRPAAHEPFPWRPVTHEPFIWRPVTHEPFTWKPVTHKPFTQKPHINHPTTEKSHISQSTTEEPDISQSTNQKPHISQPTTQKPHISHPVTQKPYISLSTTSEPVTVIPTTTSPVTSEERSDNTVYPELLVVVDYETYTTHGSDVTEVAKYIAAFWNAVDLRFRELNSPNVRLNIAGLIIPKQPDGTAYMDQFRVGTNTVLADKTLTAVGEYFSKEQSFPKDKYDIVVAMSHRNLGDIASSGKLQDGITGIATFEGVCLTQRGLSVALVRDKGGFNGITTAAHELAHTLGAPHDGDESKGVPGGPCNWADGYLMSYERKDSKGMHWSKCSKTALHNFLTSKKAQCLKNKPNAGSPYPKILPGKLLSRDEQCKRSMGLVSYKDKEYNCAVLYCAKYMQTQVAIQTEYRPPAEGSYCGEGKICLDAQCVDDPEL